MRFFLLFLPFLSFLLSAFAQTGGPVTNATEILYILSDHNNARATLATPVANNMIKLRWDPIAAQMAYNYLAKLTCPPPNPFPHNPNRSIDYWNLGGRNGLTAANSASNPIYVGENWYSGAPTNLTDTPIFGGATKAWTTGDCNGGSCCPWVCTSQICSELHLFYQDATVNGVKCTLNGPGEWGHFTQVMWATTAWVGCGYIPSCGTLCDYVVGGNFNLPSAPTAANIWGIGGGAASNCSNGTSSEGGLCAYDAVSSPPKKSNAGGIAAAVIIILLVLFVIGFVIYKRHKDPTWDPCHCSSSSSSSASSTYSSATPAASASGTSPEGASFVRTPEKSITTPDIASPSGARSPSTYVTSPTSPTGVAFTALPQSPPPSSPSAPPPTSPQVWEKIWDENQQSYYYSNPKSGVTQWEKPPEYAE